MGRHSPARPEDQLSVLVSRLRSVLGGRERIGHQDGGYRLHYDWLDAAELASLIDEVTGAAPGRAQPAQHAPFPARVFRETEPFG